MKVLCPACQRINIVGSATHVNDGKTRRALRWYCHGCAIDLIGLPEYTEPEMMLEERENIEQVLRKLGAAANYYVEDEGRRDGH